ncbi:MAG TPA: cbb3-type cytochrome c oxidase subunit I [Eudoraea sp.]|nr:cbb3-type cytochrome c oxidase subunit I [Eudoraea sp.]
MSRLIEKPHLIFLLSIPIIMLIGILSGNAVLDLNIHDTHYVIAYLHFATLIAILFGIIGVGYWIMQKTDRKLSRWLNWTHVGLSFGGT